MKTKTKPAQNENPAPGQLWVHVEAKPVDADDAYALAEKLRAALAGQDVEVEISSQPRIPELWGATEAGEFLGISYQNLYKTAGLPEPVVVLNRGRLWLADEIRDFAKNRGK